MLGTPMPLHVPQAVQALDRGVHVLSEVTAAVDLEQCRLLVAAVRRSPASYMMAENYCYRREAVLVRAMARAGLFGECYFAEGEYLHDVKSLHAHPDGRPTWRATWQVGKRGCTYGTHALGPALEFFGPRARVATVACTGSGVHTAPQHPHDDTCLMLCTLTTGGLIKVRVDMLSNRPPWAAYYALQGTKGCYEAPRGFGDEHKVWLSDDSEAGQEGAGEAGRRARAGAPGAPCGTTPSAISRGVEGPRRGRRGRARRGRLLRRPGLRAGHPGRSPAPHRRLPGPGLHPPRPHLGALDPPGRRPAPGARSEGPVVAPPGAPAGVALRSVWGARHSRRPARTVARATNAPLGLQLGAPGIAEGAAPLRPPPGRPDRPPPPGARLPIPAVAGHAGQHPGRGGRHPGDDLLQAAGPGPGACSWWWGGRRPGPRRWRCRRLC